MDNGAKDSSGDTCIWYEENHRHCGDYDDDDFDATDLCCPCKSNGKWNNSVTIRKMIKILIIKCFKIYTVIELKFIWVNLF